MASVLIINLKGERKMKFKMNNREWTITEVSQQEIKKMQNTRRANEDENLKSVDTRYYGITYCDTLKI